MKTQYRDSQGWHQNEIIRWDIEKSMTKVNHSREFADENTEVSHDNEIDPSHFGDLRNPISSERFREDTTKFFCQEEEIPDLEINGMTRRIFMSATLKTAVRVGDDEEKQMNSIKDTDFEQHNPLLDISQRLQQKYTSSQITCFVFSYGIDGALWARLEYFSKTHCTETAPRDSD